MSACNRKYSLPDLYNRTGKLLAIVVLGTVVLCHTQLSLAGQQKSRRIEVYALTENYLDTRPGDTLDKIAGRMLPNNPAKRESLKQDILRLNPTAFIDRDPSKLLANKRLWMPVYMKQADSRVDPDTTIVERYSWGNIKRSR